MSELASAPAFAGMKAIGDGGGVRVRLLRDVVITSVLAHRGQADALMEKARSRFGLPLADTPSHCQGLDLTALGIGPGRWLFLGDGAVEFSGLASLSDHSDGYAVFEVWGPQVRAALAKGVPVDLAPEVFANDVAVTVIAHIGAIIWQSAPDRFAIAVFRSYAASFWHWLCASAAEFGLAVEEAL